MQVSRCIWMSAKCPDACLAFWKGVQRGGGMCICQVSECMSGFQMGDSTFTACPDMCFSIWMGVWTSDDCQHPDIHKVSAHMSGYMSRLLDIC